MGGSKHICSPLLSAEDAAVYLGKSVKWCSRVLRRFIPLVKIGGSPMYLKDDIEKYIQSRVNQPVEIRDVKSPVSLRELIRGNRIRPKD